MFKFIDLILLTLALLSRLECALSTYSNCSHSNEWRCDNGECIDSDYMCDGKPDCQDMSDETTKNCISPPCPPYAFRCAYGACISMKKVCDGKRDCRDNSDEHDWSCLGNNNELERYERKLQGNCRKNTQVQCDSGECINEYSLCDGEPHCADGSDERVEYCSKIICPSYAFRCGYGACVSGKAKCNGLIECYDGSDELAILCGNSAITNDTATFSTTLKPIDIVPTSTITSITKTTTETALTAGEQPTSTDKPHYCIIPLTSKQLVIEDFVTKQIYNPGDIVTGDRTVISANCSKRKKLEGSQVTVCVNGEWAAPFPTCSKKFFCSNNKLIRPISTTALCYNEDEVIDCREPLPSGSTAHVTCAPGYISNDLTNETKIIQCMEKGNWSHQLPKCKPICGVAVPGARNESLPWVVSVFQQTINQNYVFKCSGTIVSEKIVLTAANCIADSDFTKSDDPILYNIVEGDYRTTYAQAEETGRTVHNISQLTLSSETTKDNRKKYIGLLFLVNYFKFSLNLAPICLPNKQVADQIEFAPRGSIFDPENNGNKIAKSYLTHIEVEGPNGNKQDQRINKFLPKIRRYLRNYRHML